MTSSPESVVISVRVRPGGPRLPGSEIRECAYCKHPVYLSKGTREDLRGKSFTMLCSQCAPVDYAAAPGAPVPIGPGVRQELRGYGLTDAQIDKVDRALNELLTQSLYEKPKESP